MIFFQIILSLIYLFISLNLSNKIHRSVISFFIVCFSLQIILAELDIYKIYTISVETIIIFNCNIIFFLLGACLYELGEIRRHKFNKYILVNKFNVLNSESFFKVNWLICIQLIFLLIALYYFNKVSIAALLFSGDESVRTYFFEQGGLFKSYTEMFLYHYFVKNYSYVASFIFVYNLLLKEKVDLKGVVLMILSLLFIGIIALTSQGRGDILPPLIMSIFIIIYSKQYLLFSYKRKVLPLTFGLAFIALISIILIGLLRVNSDVNFESFISSIDESVLEPFVIYFSVPIAAFDYGIHHQFKDCNLFWGTATFAGFQELLTTPLVFLDRSIGLINANSHLGALMSPTFSLSPSVSWNALFTGVANYYLDFGYFGVVLYPFFIGYFFSRVIFTFIIKSDFLHLMILAILFTWMFNNMISSSFQSFSNWMLLFNIIFFSFFVKRLTIK